MSKTDKKFRTALDFLLNKEGRNAQARLAKQQSIDSGYLNSIIKGRKPGSITVREKIAAHFELEYEDLLYLGRWILSGKDGNTWKTIDSMLGGTSDTKMQLQAFTAKKYSSDDKNLKLLIEWINLQNEPGDYWIFIKMEMSRKYPEFDTWLKKRRGEDHQHQLLEEQSVVGG